MPAFTYLHFYCFRFAKSVLKMSKKKKLLNARDCAKDCFINLALKKWMRSYNLWKKTQRPQLKTKEKGSCLQMGMPLYPLRAKRKMEKTGDAEIANEAKILVLSVRVEAEIGKDVALVITETELFFLLCNGSIFY